MNAAHKNPPQGVKSFTKCTVRIKARGVRTVGLGAYSDVKQETDFLIVCKPRAGNMLKASLEMMAIPGTARFMGLYHLQNLGDKSYDVTITTRTIKEPSRGLN